MPVCDCKLHLYRYKLCRHYSNPVKHECWRADYRAKRYCCSSFFPCGKPTKVRHSQEGVCGECADYFSQFGSLDKEVLQSFLDYKESKGWHKKRLDPRTVAPEKFIHPNILSALHGAQPFAPHAPMTAEPQYDRNHLAPPPPATRKAKGTERRPATPFERKVKPASECSFEQADAATGADIGEQRPLPQSPQAPPRGNSTEPCPLVRKMTEEAENFVLPNPDSPAYPGVPKLSAPPKLRRGRRLPRGAEESAAAAAAAENPTVVPALIIKFPDPAPPFREFPPAPASASVADRRSIFFEELSSSTTTTGPAPPSPKMKNHHVRSLSVDRSAATPRVQRLSEYFGLCEKHSPSYEFGCGECRAKLFKERGVSARDAGRRPSEQVKPKVEGGWV